MSGWKKVKGLFWEGSSAKSEKPSLDFEDEEGAGKIEEDLDGGSVDALGDDELAALLAGNEHAVPPGQADVIAVQDLPLATNEHGEVAIDFQAQYDLAGIPNTDEVEQLESFLSRLDNSLPQTSKIAAAEAFLGAIGKDRAAVLTDAERKIKRVRGLVVAKEEETAHVLGVEQAEIDGLTQKINEHRQRMEELNRSLEGVRKACSVEESRLQAARVFFGNMAPSK